MVPKGPKTAGNENSAAVENVFAGMNLYDKILKLDVANNADENKY